jgi:purine-binding chemotaxis protein CheW
VSDVVRRPSALPVEVDGTATREFLGFVISGDEYALPLDSVREILKPPPITPVPRSHRDVLGVITVRGVMTTVVDLRRRLRVAEGPASRYTRILLVDSGEEVLGVLVDLVSQVHRLESDEVELAGVVGSDLSEHVLGIGRPRDRGKPQDARGADILVLLDPAPLLSMTRHR